MIIPASPTAVASVARCSAGSGNGARPLAERAQDQRRQGRGRALPAIHPNLAQRYRDAVARLEEELASPELAAEAKSMLRSLIKTIKVFPGGKRGEVELELHGELAAILSFAQGARNKGGTPVSFIQVSVVAGARIGRYSRVPMEVPA